MPTFTSLADLNNCTEMLLRAFPLPCCWWQCIQGLYWQINLWISAAGAVAGGCSPARCVGSCIVWLRARLIAVGGQLFDSSLFFYVCISRRQIELNKKRNWRDQSGAFSWKKIVAKYNAPFVLKFVGGGRACGNGQRRSAEVDEMAFFTYRNVLILYFPLVFLRNKCAWELQRTPLQDPAGFCLRVARSSCFPFTLKVQTCSQALVQVTAVELTAAQQESLALLTAMFFWNCL